MRGIGAAALEELSSWSKIPDSRRNLFVGSAVKRRPPLPGFDTCGVGIGASSATELLPGSVCGASECS